MSSLSTAVLVLVFAVAVVATWLAGTRLSTSTDAIDRRFDLGDALGGVVLLAVAGSLPELAITISAAASGNLDLAAGNLIGGIAIQTMVIVLLDAYASPSQALTYLVGSLVPVLEALLVVAVVAEVEPPVDRIGRSREAGAGEPRRDDRDCEHQDEDGCRE